MGRNRLHYGNNRTQSTPKTSSWFKEVVRAVVGNSYGRGNWRNLAALAASMALLVATELVTRAVWKHQDAERTNHGIVIADKDLIWKLKPYVFGPLATNQLGLRDTPYRPHSQRKVLLLGDSVAWGDGIMNVKDVFPQRLEELLSNEDGVAYEIVNSAVPGYSTFQELAYLKLHGLGVKPDLIILQFCLNDVVERYSSLAQYGGDNVFLGVETRESIRGVYGWFIRNSRLFEFLVRKAMHGFRSVQEYKVTKLAQDQISEELRNAWHLTLSEIDGVRQVAIENNIPLLLLVCPYRFQLEEPGRLNQPQNVLLEYGRKRNVQILDLLPMFSALQDKYQGPLFKDENHFSIRGHDLAARLLMDPVRRAFKAAPGHGNLVRPDGSRQLSAPAGG